MRRPSPSAFIHRRGSPRLPSQTFTIQIDHKGTDSRLLHPTNHSPLPTKGRIRITGRRAVDLHICQEDEEAPAEQVCLSGDVKKQSACDHPVVVAFEPTLTQ